MVNVGKRAYEHGLRMVCDVPCDVMLTVAISDILARLNATCFDMALLFANF